MSTGAPGRMPLLIKAAVRVAFFASLAPGVVGFIVLAAMLPYGQPAEQAPLIYAKYLFLFVALPLLTAVLLTALSRSLAARGQVWTAVAILMLPVLAVPHLFSLALR
jgi:hypothetical protein